MAPQLGAGSRLLLRLTGNKGPMRLLAWLGALDPLTRFDDALEWPFDPDEDEPESPLVEASAAGIALTTA